VFIISHCFAGTSTLSITADDLLLGLYVDGVQTHFVSGGWKTVRLIGIPANTQVIAVKARDTARVSWPKVRL
jgi:hypothetical protein